MTARPARAAPPASSPRPLPASSAAASSSKAVARPGGSSMSVLARTRRRYAAKSPNVETRLTPLQLSHECVLIDRLRWLPAPCSRVSVTALCMCNGCATDGSYHPALTNITHTSTLYNERIPSLCYANVYQITHNTAICTLVCKWYPHGTTFAHPKVTAPRVTQQNTRKRSG